MKRKVLLILVDGMRPDSIENISEAKELKKRAAFTLTARTVTPSVTLPCHMSLFHSVIPERHGTTTNLYAQQVRPINGLCEVLSRAGKQCAFFYEWAELRDLVRPGSLAFSYFCSGRFIGREAMNDKTAAAAKKYLAEEDFDFSFLYLGYTDWAGHAYGWMSPEYMYAMENTWRNIDMVLKSLPEEYTVIITADHGGHDRTHGTEMPEDMTIPLFMLGNGIEKDADLSNASLLDVAPTVVKLLDIAPDPEWEGRALL